MQFFLQILCYSKNSVGCLATLLLNIPFDIVPTSYHTEFLCGSFEIILKLSKGFVSSFNLRGLMLDRPVFVKLNSSPSLQHLHNSIVFTYSCRSSSAIKLTSLQRQPASYILLGSRSSSFYTQLKLMLIMVHSLPSAASRTRSLASSMGLGRYISSYICSLSVWLLNLNNVCHLL